VPAEIAPPELAHLVDFAERPRLQEWSLRAALVRYAQPEPQRVSDVLDVVRRIEWVLTKQRGILERDGESCWSALVKGGDGPDAFVVGVLRAAQAVDDLGEVLATWAVDRNGHEPPDAEVDRVVSEVAQQLDALGVPREEPRPPGQRNRGV
jgi:hypothetical protein